LVHDERDPLPRGGKKSGTISHMIKLTRLDGERFVLNAELIRYVEARPDTFITLTNGERLVVRESMDEVLHLTIDYQRSKNLFPPAASPEPHDARKRK
jgi:flagellar protein FlbD